MKYFFYASLVPMALSLTGCAPNYQDFGVMEGYEGVDGVIVQETYVHKYGVAVPQAQWTTAGQHGQVISQLGNGVTATKNYAGGVLDGTATYTFPNSQLIEKVETYIQGVLVKDVVNYSSGATKRESQYLTPTTVTVTSWAENGSPLSVENFEGSLLSKGDYYNSAHQLESSVLDGSGIRLIRDGYGQLEAKDTIQEGKLSSRLTLHPKGTPNEIIPYKNGVVDGEKRTFLPEGEPNTIEQWVNGEQQGLTRLYKNGERWAEIPYVHGVKEGVEVRFGDDGTTVVQEITWVNNQRHGTTKTYVAKVVTTEWYWRGEKVDRPAFNKNGDPAVQRVTQMQTDKD